MKHIPIPPDPFPHFRLGNMANSATAGLVHAKRAFEGAIGLLPSKARNPFSPDGSNAVLNVEMFGGDDDSDFAFPLARNSRRFPQRTLAPLPITRFQ